MAAASGVHANIYSNGSTNEEMIGEILIDRNAKIFEMLGNPLSASLGYSSSRPAGIKRMINWELVAGFDSDLRRRVGAVVHPKKDAPLYPHDVVGPLALAPFLK